MPLLVFASQCLLWVYAVCNSRGAYSKGSHQASRISVSCHGAYVQASACLMYAALAMRKPQDRMRNGQNKKVYSEFTLASDKATKLLDPHAAGRLWEWEVRRLFRDSGCAVMHSGQATHIPRQCKMGTLRAGQTEALLA